MDAELEHLYRAPFHDDAAQLALRTELVRRGKFPGGHKHYAKAFIYPGSWILPKNHIWNVPGPPFVSEVPFEQESTSWGVVHKLRGLVVSRVYGAIGTPRDKLPCGPDGRVYGVRTLSGARQDGYRMIGRVSIGGKFHRAYTGSVLFQRPDGSLCNVAVLCI